MGSKLLLSLRQSTATCHMFGANNVFMHSLTDTKLRFNVRARWERRALKFSFWVVTVNINAFGITQASDATAHDDTCQSVKGTSCPKTCPWQSTHDAVTGSNVMGTFGPADTATSRRTWVSAVYPLMHNLTNAIRTHWEGGPPPDPDT